MSFKRLVFSTLPPKPTPTPASNPRWVSAKSVHDVPNGAAFRYATHTALPPEWNYYSDAHVMYAC